MVVVVVVLVLVLVLVVAVAVVVVVVVGVSGGGGVAAWCCGASAASHPTYVLPGPLLKGGRTPASCASVGLLATHPAPPHPTPPHPTPPTPRAQNPAPHSRKGMHPPKRISLIRPY